MKRYQFEILALLSIEDQLQFVVDNEIFENNSILPIRDFPEYFKSQEEYSIYDIKDNSGLIPTQKYLEYTYNEFLNEIKHYETGEKISHTEQWFNYEFEADIIFALNDEDVLEVALSLKKKAVKTLKKKELLPPFLSMTPCYEIHELRDSFYQYWVEDVQFLGPGIKVNEDILSFAFSEAVTEISNVVLTCSNFLDWTNVIGTIRIIKFLDNIILDCRKGVFMNNNDSSPIPRFFLDRYFYKLFIKCINADPKTTKRKFSVYYNIFQQFSYIRKYQGADVDFIVFVKEEFEVSITRIEKEFYTENTFEENIFHKILAENQRINM